MAFTADFSGESDEKYKKLIQSKEKIISLLRDKGYRITRQRQVILDVIFSYDCASCKEIYYQAKRTDPTIGMATVYRMVNTLTDAGVLGTSAIKPRIKENMDGCCIRLDDNREIRLSREEWMNLLEKALWKKGVSGPCNIVKVIVR